MKASLATLRTLGRQREPMVEDYRDAPEPRGGVRKIPAEKAENPHPLAPEPARETARTAESRMHERLIEWGEVMRDPAPVNPDDDRDPEPRPTWDAVTQARAMYIQSLMVALARREGLLNVVMQVFYKSSSAKLWDQLGKKKQGELLARYTQEANDRLSRAGDLQRVHSKGFHIVRARAVRELVALSATGLGGKER